MLNLLRITASAALLTIFTGVSLAETVAAPPPGRGPAAMKKPKGEPADPTKRLNLMKASLALSDEQTAKIRPLIVAEQAEVEKLRGDNTLNRDQRRAKLQELNRNSSEKIRELLTPEQQIRHDAIKAKIAENRAGIRSSRPTEMVPAEFTPEKRIARLTERLSLTKEQQEQIMPILQDEYGQLKTLPADDSYNRDQRRAKLQQITQESVTRIMPVLTPEQQKKYQKSREMMIDRRSRKKKSGEQQEQGVRIQ